MVYQRASDVFSLAMVGCRTNPQLFMADGQHWQEQRRRTAPAFNEVRPQIERECVCERESERVCEMV